MSCGSVVNKKIQFFIYWQVHYLTYSTVKRCNPNKQTVFFDYIVQFIAEYDDMRDEECIICVTTKYDQTLLENFVKLHLGGKVPIFVMQMYCQEKKIRYSLA